LQDLRNEFNDFLSRTWLVFVDSLKGWVVAHSNHR
jgi:hypothetical protein